MADLWVPSSAHASVSERFASAASARVDSSPEVAEMRANRRVNAERNRSVRTGAVTNQTSFVSGRPHDPMWYWRQNNVEFDFTNEDSLAALRQFCRLIYVSHPVLGPAIDVFSKFPLVSMEFGNCKDKELTDWYSEQFFDHLHYDDYGVKSLREYFIAGEAWPFGSFNELLGVWEDDELLNPDDIRVIKSPILRQPRFEMRLSESLRRIISEREPRYEYAQLVANYPELVRYGGDDDWLPVSNELLKFLKYDANTFHPRGMPLLLRAMRAITQEEMLNSAQDAIADRLSTPLILVKLGASATDLGTQEPWIPDEGQIMAFEEMFDTALAADFRVVTTHFAVDVSQVLGKENMPDFGPDFDRLTKRMLGVFGMSETLLTGAGQGETYAADALNRDLMSQILGTAQKLWKRFVRERCLIVAEAQEHYDYDVVGGRRVPIMEEVLEVDEETGEQRIVEQNKLLIPELILKSMNLNQEKEFHDFVEQLVASGVPISTATRMVNVPIDLGDEIEQRVQEQVTEAVAEQELRQRTYLALKQRSLPIPDDLRQDFDPKVLTPHQPPVPPAASAPAGGDGTPSDPSKPPPAPTDPPLPSLMTPPAPENNMAPDQNAPGAAKVPQGPSDPKVNQLPRNKARPPESDEQRAGMPKSASLRSSWSALRDGPSSIGHRQHRIVVETYRSPGLDDVEWDAPDETKDAEPDSPVDDTDKRFEELTAAFAVELPGDLGDE